MTQPAIGDYHVGWICAVGVEYTFARTLLDEIYIPPPTVEQIYTYGRLGEHLVVMVCLPKGAYGMTSATVAALRMRLTFPSIRFGLMVGIAGGVPSEGHDIRLGDIVVSSPTGLRGGVIHYESGKSKQDQPFEQTGTLDRPPELLLHAVSHLNSIHAMDGHKINQTIDGVISKYPRLKRVYQRPSPETDLLFPSSVPHPDSTKQCQIACQRDLAIHRSDRDPSEDNPCIHYGLIASADKVMKDAILRDNLAKGENILAFDMEAAGLMNHFSCIVIRGICDYADSHKNEIWQGFAAAAAAAYVKELLAIIPSKQAISNDTVCTYQDSSSRNSPTTTTTVDPFWSALDSRQPTFSDLEQTSVQQASRTKTVSPEQIWVRCGCDRDCHLEWNFMTQLGEYRKTSTVGDMSQCDIKLYVDNHLKSPVWRLFHHPFVGRRSEPLWHRMRDEWQMLAQSKA